MDHARAPVHGIRDYALREAFHLACEFVAFHGLTDALTLDGLLTEVRRLDADWVLVTGPSSAAFRALHQVRGVHVLILSDALTDVTDSPR